jgi:hypothetical protein
LEERSRAEVMRRIDCAEAKESQRLFARSTSPYGARPNPQRGWFRIEPADPKRSIL